MIKYFETNNFLKSIALYQTEGEDFNHLSIQDLEPSENIFTYKGNLRISWSFDIAYNKNIDLIFFPEDDDYFNYVLLYANDFNKKVSDESTPREIIKCDIPYNINYDFVKEILSNSNISEFKQKKFLDSRFGSIFIPMEIEFEWYSVFGGDAGTKFTYYDEYLKNTVDDGEYPSFYCIGIIKSFKILPDNTSLNFNLDGYVMGTYVSLNDNDEHIGHDHHLYIPINATSLFTPLPNTAFAITISKKVDDYFVNVRDKPSVKEGKIVAQLFTQEFFCDSDDFSDEMIKQGEILLKSRYDSLSMDETGYALYYVSKQQESYYQTNKSNMINPIWKDAYIVFIEAILPNNWCKVLVLKSPTFEIVEIDNIYSRIIVQQDFLDSFNYAISTITLASGYIHSSGLEYLMPFPKQ